MSTEAVAVGMVPDELKHEPRSKGLNTPRKKKPKELAVITECCTGCAGSPACVEYCPVEDCMFWVPDEDHPPFGRIQIDPILCIGCKKCISKGPDGCFLDGCPWDAIAMVDTAGGKRSRGDADLNRVGTAALGCPAERSSAAPNPRARIQLLSSLANCPLCLGGLLPHMLGDIGQIALIRVDGRNVVGLPNQIQRT